MRDLEGQIANMSSRWMTGGSAASAAPADWPQADATDLALIALAGQALTFLFEPVAPTLNVRPPLPMLDAPTLNPEQRALYHRAAKAVAQSSVWKDALVWLAAARGYALSPADWMPATVHVDAPEIYLPWMNWLEGSQTRADDAPLSAENWNDWGWRERLRALWSLRHADAPAALALIEMFAAKEPADRRVVLVQTLSNNLSQNDALYLQSLANDRSDRVKTIAAALLARLGFVSMKAEDLAELVAFFKISETGIFKKTRQVVPNKLKTDAQKKRRSELMAATSLAAFARGLGFEPVQLIQNYDFSADDNLSSELVALTVETGAQDAIAALIATQEKAFTLHSNDLSRVLDVADANTRQNWIDRYARSNSAADYQGLAQLAGHDVGCIGPTTLRAAPVIRQIDAALRKMMQKPDSPLDYYLSHALDAISMLATQDGAAYLIALFTSGENARLASDPLLDILHFNVALKGNAGP